MAFWANMKETQTRMADVQLAVVQASMTGVRAGLREMRRGRS